MSPAESKDLAARRKLGCFTEDIFTVTECLLWLACRYYTHVSSLVEQGARLIGHRSKRLDYAGARFMCRAPRTNTSSRILIVIIHVTFSPAFTSLPLKQATVPYKDSTMSATVIETVKESLTVEDVLGRDLDTIPTLHSLQKTFDFQDRLWLQRSQIEDLISRHLGIPKSDFVLSEPSKWIWGSFNICVFIDVDNTRNSNLPPKAIIRFPLPFECGEAYNPDIVDEKLRCEAATYIWFKKNCPTIPTPRLLGMGFPGTQSVSIRHASDSFGSLCADHRQVHSHRE